MATLARDEALELARSVRAACTHLATDNEVRSVAFREDGRAFHTELWHVLCQQVGVSAIAIPEIYGGAGYGASALGVVAAELGRALAPVPFLASAVLATGLLTDFGCGSDILEPLATGERSAAAVITSDGGAWDRSRVTLTARRRGDQWTVNGQARHVLHGETADTFVVIALVDNEPIALLVDAADPGVRIDAEPVLDGTRPMATVVFSGSSGVPLLGSEPTEAIVARNVDRTIAVLSAEQVGSCEKLLEFTTEYARTRVQFGRPIGSFQAVKHMCANMLVSLEWARSASQAALDAADVGGGAPNDELPWRASMAKAICSEALRDAAHTSTQIHGAVGFSWEGPVNLHLRRARTDEVIFGGLAEHWDRLAAHVAPPRPHVSVASV
ncbi:acyl-CoA dehydrogenase family protein [Mycobacterium palustre]|uniref:Acyl-CoA dehydrogenase n=1 Tax=Mycobacterium palustre TaxID=153971 RepID=A0A1X1ZVU2_9MYCO|nr:acyl-CoA dehydrogenase family protein [Mycobacterium palustre]MCV7101379.1 acyl-CoA dehydrogenase family protein [Mycobacterium palustre]ORW28269.1 acyl-CoA dehydrogenase [Mycobacterium palustre]